jgi:hypothetical protein
MSMRDTDWRPTRCPDCDEMRSAEEAPICENPHCDSRRGKGVGWPSAPAKSLPTDPWPPKSPDRRISKPQPVVFYVLRDWDGGGGTSNRPNGFIVQDKKLADEWKKVGGTGVDYITYEGVMVQRLEDIPGAKDLLARQKALSKLTAKEKELLGLK